MYPSVTKSLASFPADGGRSLEIELKLTGRPNVLSAAFESLNGVQPRTSKIASTYYDTADGRFWRHGFTFRLRPKGGEYELTLKHEGSNKLERGEWTSRIPEPVADIGLLPADAPRSKFGAILPEELEPRFYSEVERTQTELRANSALVEVSLDNGRIVAGERDMPVAEMEFELLGGPVSDMLQCVRSVIQNRRLEICVRSKAARGMDLLSDAPPAYVKAAKPILDPTDTIDRAVSAIVSATTMQILGNVAAAADGRDPEGVHQLRVALRRLRSAMSLFKSHLALRRASALNEDAKRALNLLGLARDLDVFLLETMPPVIDGNPDEPAVRRLAKIAEERRVAAYEDVRRLTADRRFNRFLLDLLLIAQDGGLTAGDRQAPLGPVATALLNKRHKNSLKAGRNFAKLANEKRHETRIALKKLRYACDFFQTLYPGHATRPYLKRLSTLQDDLGHLNDATVAEHLASELARDDRQAAIAAAVVKGWYGHRLQAIDAHMVNAWQRFTKATPYWLITNGHRA